MPDNCYWNSENGCVEICSAVTSASMTRIYPLQGQTLPTVGGEQCLTFKPYSGLFDMVRDGSGNTHLVYVADITTGTTYPFDRPFMFHQKSTDNGATWSAPVHIGGTSTPTHQNYFINGWGLAACTDDLDGAKIYAYMVGYYIADYRLFQVVSTDSGATWGSITSVYQETDDGTPDLMGNIPTHRPSVRGNRRVIPVQIDDPSLPLGVLITSNGSSWSRVGVASNAQGANSGDAPTVTTIGADDTVHMAWHGLAEIRYCKITGTTPGTQVTITTDGTAWFAPAIAMKQSGSAVRIAHHIQTDSGGNWPDKIYIRESADGGSTFPTLQDLAITTNFNDPGAVRYGMFMGFAGNELLASYTCYDSNGVGERKAALQTTSSGQALGPYLPAADDESGITANLRTMLAANFFTGGALTAHANNSTILVNKWVLP